MSDNYDGEVAFAIALFLGYGFTETWMFTFMLAAYAGYGLRGVIIAIVGFLTGQIVEGDPVSKAQPPESQPSPIDGSDDDDDDDDSPPGLGEIRGFQPLPSLPKSKKQDSCPPRTEWVKLGGGRYKCVPLLQSPAEAIAGPEGKSVYTPPKTTGMSYGPIQAVTTPVSQIAEPDPGPPGVPRPPLIEQIRNIWNERRDALKDIRGRLETDLTQKQIEGLPLSVPLESYKKEGDVAVVNVNPNLVQDWLALLASGTVYVKEDTVFFSGAEISVMKKPDGYSSVSFGNEVVVDLGSGWSSITSVEPDKPIGTAIVPYDAQAQIMSYASQVIPAAIAFKIGYSQGGIPTGLQQLMGTQLFQELMATVYRHANLANPTVLLQQVTASVNGVVETFYVDKEGWSQVMMKYLQMFNPRTGGTTALRQLGRIEL